MVDDDVDYLLAGLLPGTRLVHGFAVLSDGVRAARLVILKHILHKVKTSKGGKVL